MEQPTLFTRIIQGQIPCHKLYEDATTFVFLDIRPLLPGHALVVPKRPVEFVWDLPDDDYQALMATTKRTALRLRDVMQTTYVAERVIGVDVPHAHVHLIPFNNSADLRRSSEDDAPADEVELAKLAEALAF